MRSRPLRSGNLAVILAVSHWSRPSGVSCVPPGVHRHKAALAAVCSHHALVRYASSGAEALLAWDSQALRDLIAARKAEDWAKVGAIVDWLESGLNSPHWH